MASLIFKFAASRFVNGSDNEINMREKNAFPRNTKHATETSVKCEDSATTDFEPIFASFWLFLRGRTLTKNTRKTLAVLFTM